MIDFFPEIAGDFVTCHNVGTALMWHLRNIELLDKSIVHGRDFSTDITDSVLHVSFAVEYGVDPNETGTAMKTINVTVEEELR